MTRPGGDSGRRFDLLVVGELNPDIIVLQPDLTPMFGQVESIVERIDLEIGSSAAIVACGAAQLGLRVAFVGVVGDDQFGRFMLESLAARGIDIEHCRVDPFKPTGATVILSRGVDRAILTARGTMTALTADDVPARLVREVRHIHVGGLFLQPALAAGLPRTFAQARTAGTTTSLDTNWAPSGEWAHPMLGSILAETDLFLPNAAELAALSGETDIETGARALLGRMTPGGGTVAVKCGPRGAVGVRATEEVRVPAPTVAVIDTTGAGDSFDAGMIAGLLDGASLESAIRMGVACGSLSTLAVGGTAAQPDRPTATAAAASL